MEGNSFKGLLLRIKPTPIDALTDWPPPSVVLRFVHECRSRGRWEDLAEVMRILWDQLHGDPNAPENPMKPENKFFSDSGTWTRFRAPLVEAFLNLGSQTEAQQVVDEWAARCGSRPDLKGLSQVADSLKLTILAESWRKAGTAPR